MNRLLCRLLSGCALLLASLSVRAGEATAPATKPLNVLFITGGGYHDYGHQGPFLKKNLEGLANVKIEIVSGGKDSHATPELFSDPKFGEGYDAIIYDLCYAVDNKPVDPKRYEKAFEVTKAGKPAILIHCAMHCFRPAKDWAEFAGMRTNHHEKFGPFDVRPADTKNPITKGWPEDWKTAGDEQYVTEETYPDTVKLLISTGVGEKAKHPENVVAWEHTYGQGRVFATTLGHDMKTTADPHYLQLLANGLLWACDKLDENGNPKPGYAGPGPKAAVGAEKK
jgi:type 1 glutamine amidotransferase